VPEARQLNHVKIELLCTFLIIFQGLLIDIIADSDLSFNEDVMDRRQGFFDRLSHLALISVSGCRINVTISGLDCAANGALRYVWRLLKDTKAYRWNAYTIVKRE
jgi:hypothetical protein